MMDQRREEIIDGGGGGVQVGERMGGGADVVSSFFYEAEIKPPAHARALPHPFPPGRKREMLWAESGGGWCAVAAARGV